ncbi:PREDICTED: uncharacterized protein LOC109480680 [Branchiostoma belcheri]|uniref:Uncharacterized protein LOC109480680 n=1 Tax=Branchiostoma belcheri TaxID=7741 RepID=A0A6P4ZNS8_BRABE|nr:PREDICTED: uncharacterized protein LOC109480680 [Branchiostoma belcheri]
MAAAAVDSVSRLYKDLEKTYSEAMDGVEKAAEEAVASVTFPIFNIPQGQLIPAQCWKIMYLLKPASPSYACPVRKKNIRRRRCNKCKGCLVEDCGRCYDCQRKRICKKKKCLDPLLPPATRCLICTQTGTVSALSECSTCGEILHPRCVAVLGERSSKDGRTSQTWECPKCCQGKIAHTGGRTYSGPLPTLLENSLLLAGFTDYLARNCWALGLCDTDSLGWGGDPGEILRQLAGIWVEHLPIAKKGLSGEDFEGLVVSLEDSVAVLEWYGQNHGMFDGLVPLARRMVGVVEEVKSGYWEEEDPYLVEKTELPRRKRSSRKSQATTSKKSPRSASDSSPLEKKSSLFRFLTSGHSSADSSPVVPASDVCSPESCTDTATENSLAYIQPADKTTSLPTPQVEDKQVVGVGEGPNKEPDSGTPSDLSNTPDSDPFPQFSRKSDSAFPSSWYVEDSDSEDYLPTPPRCPSPQPANQTDRNLPVSPQPSPKRLREDSSDYMNDALDVMFEHAHPSLSSTSGSIKMSANSATADDFVNDVRKKLQDFFSATEAREARYEESPSFSNSTGSLAPPGHTYQRQAMVRESPHAGLEIRQNVATTQSLQTGYPQAAFPQQMQPGHWDPTINRPPPGAGQSATGYNSICHCAACCRPQTYMQQPHHSRASKKTQRTAPPVSHTPAGRRSHATVANIPPVRSYSPSWHATNPQLQAATNGSGMSSYHQGSCGNDGLWFDVNTTPPMPTAYRATVQMSLAPQETRKVQGHPAQPRVPLGDSNRYIPPARYGGMRSKGTKDAQHHSYWPV